jgi:hypothetical protein
MSFIISFDQCRFEVYFVRDKYCYSCLFWGAIGLDVSYTQRQIEDFVERVTQFNTWFPEHGSLDPDSWKQIGEM